MAPTMDDVARSAGVSRSLVSLVFQGSAKVSPKSRRRVLKAAERLGYRPNALARGLASRQSRTVGVLINDLHNPFFAAVYDGVAAGAAQAGYQLLLATGDRSPGREVQAVETFLQHQVQGLVLLSPRMSAARLRPLTVDTPTVVVGRTPTVRSVDVVTNDEDVGAALAVDLLVSLGHRRIVHVAGARQAAGAKQREQGYVAAMTAAGLSDQVDVVPADFTEEAGAAAARLLLRRDRLPTAVFAANDLCASGVLSVFAENGIRVPEDVSVVGYDNTALARLGVLSLTTIEQPLATMGQRAFELLVERMAGTRTRSRSLLVEPQLVVRRTTAPARPISDPRAEPAA